MAMNVSKIVFEVASRLRVRGGELSEATSISKNTLSRMQSVYGNNMKAENLDRLYAYFDWKIEDHVEYVSEK